MFAIKNDIPFVFDRLDDPGVLQRLRDLCMSLEGDVLRLARSPSFKDVPGHETTARYANYNLLLVKDPLLLRVYGLIKSAYHEMLAALERPREPVFIQCWMNIHRKGEGLFKHAHGYPIHGHLTVYTEGTSTVYGDDESLSLPNEIGLLTLLGKPGVQHRVTAYPADIGARVSIAFDILPLRWIETNPRWLAAWEERQFIPFD